MMKQSRKSLPPTKDASKAMTPQKKPEPPALPKPTPKALEKTPKPVSKPVVPEKTATPRPGVQRGSKEEVVPEVVQHKKPVLYKAKTSVTSKPSSKVAETNSKLKTGVGSKTQDGNSDQSTNLKQVEQREGIEPPTSIGQSGDASPNQFENLSSASQVLEHLTNGINKNQRLQVTGKSIEQLEPLSDNLPTQITQLPSEKQQTLPHPTNSNSNTSILKPLKYSSQIGPSNFKAIDMVMPDATGTETDIETPFGAKEGFFRSQFNVSLLENSERIELPSPGLPLRILRLSYENSKSDLLEIKDSQRNVQVNFHDQSPAPDRLNVSRGSLAKEATVQSFSLEAQNIQLAKKENGLEFAKGNHRAFNNTQPTVGMNPLLNGSDGLENHLHYNLNRGVGSFESKSDEGNDNGRNFNHAEQEINLLNNLVPQMDIEKLIEFNQHEQSPLKNAGTDKRNLFRNEDTVGESKPSQLLPCFAEEVIQLHIPHNLSNGNVLALEKKPSKASNSQNEIATREKEAQQAFDDIKALIQNNNSPSIPEKAPSHTLKDFSKTTNGKYQSSNWNNDQHVEFLELEGDDKDEVSQLLNRYSSPIFHRNLNKSIEKITTEMKRDRIRYSHMETTKSSIFEKKPSILDDANFLPPEFLKACLQEPLEKKQSCVSFRNIQDVEDKPLAAPQDDIPDSNAMAQEDHCETFSESSSPKITENFHTVDLDEADEIKVNSQRFMSSMKRLTYNTRNESRKYSVMSAYSDVLQDLHSPALIRPNHIDFGVIREKYQEESECDSRMTNRSNKTIDSSISFQYNQNKPKDSLKFGADVNVKPNQSDHFLKQPGSMTRIVRSGVEPDRTEFSGSQPKLPDTFTVKFEKVDSNDGTERTQTTPNNISNFKETSTESNSMVSEKQNLMKQENTRDQNSANSHLKPTPDGLYPRISVRTAESSNARHQSSDLFRSLYNSRSKTPIDVLARLMQKVLVYGSKIEHLKLELLSMNPDFKVDRLFQTYSKGRSSLDTEALLKFFRSFELSVPETTIRAFICYIKKLVKMPRQSDRVCLNLIQFALLFMPVSQDASLLMAHMGFGIDSNRSIEQKPTLETEAEFHLVKQILIIWLRKLDDIGRTFSLIHSETHEDMFAMIAGSSESTIGWKMVCSFLDSCNVKFLDEDIIHVFREMSGQNLTSINFSNFKAYLSP
jgi:hypothetical protein